MSSSDIDIDHLLDEIESIYCNESSNATTDTQQNTIDVTVNYDTTTPIRTSQSLNTIDELDREVERLLNDFRSINESSDTSNNSMNKLSGRSLDLVDLIRNGVTKCKVTHLTGSSTVLGVSTSSTIAACNMLKCTACDFKVIIFNNYKWTNKVNYLFFRNFMPDRQKVATQLKISKGCRSYACQCSWISISTIIDINKINSVKDKWVCGKH